MNYIKSALHNLSYVENASADYRKGIVVGVVSALMERGWSYQEAIAEVVMQLPRDPDESAFPPAWADDIKKAMEDRHV
jgi:hypothetical protein